MFERDVDPRVGTDGILDVSPPVRLRRPTGSGPSVSALTDDGRERTADRVAATVLGALQRTPAAGVTTSTGRVQAASSAAFAPLAAVPAEPTSHPVGPHSSTGRVRRATGIVQREVNDDSVEPAGFDGFLERRRTERGAPPRKRLDAGAGAGISEHLVDTGRANQLGGDARARLGGKRSHEADVRAETHAAEVLAGLEAGTRANQLKTNPSAVTTHAVSGHGPGTDQESRLLHGRRNDQLIAENGVAPGPRTTVGDDPSNTSGAFTTARGMLHAVTEGFAQAHMFSSHADDTASRRGPGSSRVDETRFVTNVTGPSEDEELGYNLELRGHHSQQKGAALAHDEIDQRRGAIERTDGLTRARVVLDPAFVDGRRAGWNLQTAYANADAPTTPLTQRADVEGQTMSFEADVGARERDIASAKTRLERAIKDKQGHLETIDQKRQNVNRLELLVASRPVPPVVANIDEMRTTLDQLGRELSELADDGPYFSLFDEGDVQPVEEADDERQHDRDTLTTQIAELKLQYDAAVALRQLGDSRAELSELESTTLDKDGLITEARKGVASAEAQAAQAARTLAEHRAAERDRRTRGDAGSTPRAEGKGAAGYDPATGTYTGDRPSKLGNQLRGTDEEGDALTAHHLYPWNKIKDDLNKALASKDRGAMETLFEFGDVEVDASFWDELGKPSGQRSYAFSEKVNAAAQKICWSPRNVFMGPLSSKRGDDPKEGLDTAFTKSGLPTSASAAAKLVHATGGIVGATPDTIARDITAQYLAARDANSVAQLDEACSRELEAKIALAQGKRRLAELVMQRTREAQGSETRPYDQSDWTTDDEGKRVRAGRVTSNVHARSVQTAEIDALMGHLVAVAEEFSARLRKEADALVTALRSEATPH